MNKPLLLILLSLIVLASGCSTPPPRLPLATIENTSPVVKEKSQLGIGDIIRVGYLKSPKIEAEDSPYKVSTGDLLRVDVNDHPQLSRERVIVLQDGYISLPLIGRVEAAGQSLDHLSKSLVKQYVGFNIIKPDVVVSVEEVRDPLNPLLRLVRRGDRYEPLRFVIAEDDYLDLPYINPVNVRTNISELRKDIKHQYAELFGDQLQVLVQLEQAAPPVLYVIGEVNAPGEVAYSKQYNPLLAIAAAGGLQPTANGSDIRLFRLNGNTYSGWSLDIAKGFEDGMNEPAKIPLQPGDVLYVPPTGVALANRKVEQYIRNMLPITVGFGFSYQLNEHDD